MEVPPPDNEVALLKHFYISTLSTEMIR